MANTVEITLKTIVDKAVSDLKKASGAVGDVDKSAQKASGGTNQLTSAMSSLAGTLGIAAGVGVLVNAVKKFSAEAVEAAARSQELNAKFNIVFGQSAPQAKEALEAFGDEVNRSKLELQEMASDLQAVLSAMGLNRGAASDYSVELTKLAVDVAAFNNSSDTEVLVAFRSAMVGEYEPMKKFGVVLNEAAVKAELLTMGIEGGTQAATAAEKAQARYNIIMRATTDAHGMAAKEVDSYTSVTKGLNGAMLDLKVAVGENLLPTMTDLKIALTDLVQATTEAVEKDNLWHEAIALGIITVSEYGNKLSDLTLKHQYTNEELEELIAKFKEENGIVDDVASSVNELAVKQQSLAGAMDEATAAQQRLEAAQQSWMTNTANQVDNALKNLNVGSEQYTAALGIIDNQMGTNKVSELEQTERINALVAEYKKTGDLIAFGDALYKLKNDYMPDTTEEVKKAQAAVRDLRVEIEELRAEAAVPIVVKVEVEQSGDLELPGNP